MPPPSGGWGAALPLNQRGARTSSCWGPVRVTGEREEVLGRVRATDSSEYSLEAWWLRAWARGPAVEEEFFTQKYAV